LSSTGKQETFTHTKLLLDRQLQLMTLSILVFLTLMLM